MVGVASADDRGDREEVVVPALLVCFAGGRPDRAASWPVPVPRAVLAGLKVGLAAGLAVGVGAGLETGLGPDLEADVGAALEVGLETGAGVTLPAAGAFGGVEDSVDEGSPGARENRGSLTPRKRPSDAPVSGE